MAAGSGNVSNIMQNGGAYNSAVPGNVLPIGQYATVTTLVATGGGTGNEYLSFGSMRSNSVGGTYQVPSGKTYFSPGFFVDSDTAPVNFKVLFGYATSTFTSGTTSAPTGATYYNNSASADFTAGAFQIKVSTAATPIWVPLPVSFPALSYPFIVNNQGTSFTRMLMLIGQEL